MTTATGSHFQPNTWLRVVSLAMAFVFVWTNILFAQRANPSFWEERREAIQKRFGGNTSQHPSIVTTSQSLQSPLANKLLAQLPVLQAQLSGIGSTVQHPMSAQDNVVAQFTSIPSFSKGGLGRIMNNPPQSPFRKGGSSGLTTTPDESGNYKFNGHNDTTGTMNAVLSSITPYADIREIYSPSLAPGPKSLAPVFIIQDVHQHYEAQKNIANVVSVVAQFIERLSKHDTTTAPDESGNYNPAIVLGLEGAVGPFDFTSYRAFSEKELVKDIADFFVQNGMIGGPEFYGITAQENLPMQMIGVEDEKLYLDNIQAFKDSLPIERQVKVKVEKIQAEVKVKKEKIFKPELLELDRKREAYHEGKLGLGDYLASLKNMITTFDVVAQFIGRRSKHPTTTTPDKSGNYTTTTPDKSGNYTTTTPDKSGNYTTTTPNELGNYERNAITQKRYNAMNVSHLVEAYRTEKSLDITKLEKERAEILEVLSKKLPKPTLDELLNSALAYRTGSITYAQFYVYFKQVSQSAGINFSQFPEMNKYVRYVQLADGIDKNKLFTEIQQLENAIENKLAKTNEEKELLQQSKYLELVKKLVEFSLTPKEWEQYKIQAQSNSKAVIASVTKQSQVSSDREIASADNSQPRNDGMNLSLLPFEQFYETALKRNEALLSNLLKSSNRDNVVAQFTGGEALSSFRIGRRSNDNTTTTPDESGNYNEPNERNNSMNAVAVLVVGGFHTQGITQLLKSKSIPYVVLAPNITKVDEGQKSLELLAQSKTPLEKLFAGEKVFLVKPLVGGVHTNLGQIDNTNPIEELSKQKIGSLINSILTHGLVSKREAEKLSISLMQGADGDNKDGGRGALVTVAEIASQKTYDSSRYGSYEDYLEPRLRELLVPDLCRSPVIILSERRYTSLPEEVKENGFEIINERLESGALILMSTDESIADLMKRAKVVDGANIFGYDKIDPNEIDAIFVPEDIFYIVRNSVPKQFKKR